MWEILIDQGPVSPGRPDSDAPELISGLAEEVLQLAPGLEGSARVHLLAGTAWEDRAAAAHTIAAADAARTVFLTLRWNGDLIPEHRGLSIYFPVGCARSEALARGLLGLMRERLAPEFPVFWAGVWPDNCPLLLAAPKPAVRICPGFVTNADDLSLFGEASFRRRFAEALMTTLARNLGLRFVFVPGAEDWLDRDLRLPSGVSPGQLRRALKRTCLNGLHMTFLEAEAETGVSALYLCAHALRETARFPDMARIKHNVLAYGCDREDPYARAAVFSTAEECIQVVADVLRRDYLSPDGSRYHGPTLKGIGLTYSFDPHWPHELAAIMARIDSWNRETRRPRIWHVLTRWVPGEGR